MSTTVVVCGTINVDTFVSVNKFPVAGETIIGEQGPQSLGGKGANQAVACALMGPHTVLLSAVGNDPNGDMAVAELQDRGVNVEYVEHTDLPTGQAFIMNDSEGENIIIVTSGANQVVNPSLQRPIVQRLRQQGSVPVVLAQGELTPEHSALLPRLVQNSDSRLVLNLAPVTTRDQDLLRTANPLIVNATEARDVLELDFDTPIEQVLEQLTKLSQSVVVTLGAQGAVVVDEGRSAAEAVWIPAAKLDQVVDTTGAGDAFVGTVTAALAEGATLVEACRLGNAAGALATQKRGAATSYANAAEVKALAAQAQ
ncbi:ribokinase [Corynebacterium sp. 320]|uniref:ribokinase n=1 Tax=Corynebacterium TaxID=1716 RepID=UPI00125CC6C5|nr:MULTISPECIES: ribokinase [Corynebacterium]KAB1502826.1 ribokinase [Corynebacterium sp. 320]KAB1550433.1 ribokinase [Corynebacterium sp. 319]KAB1554836.1 ribokinase [Corynebacterium sp. 321]KAB3526489.1 ribokinase [Corynebacterium sp. 250]KAB3539808.1 ribokinase [Corynebacterium sp. 366]